MTSQPQWFQKSCVVQWRAMLVGKTMANGVDVFSGIDGGGVETSQPAMEVLQRHSQVPMMVG